MNIADEIKSRVTTKDLCEALDIRVNHSGFAYCPFHEERKSPSLKVYADSARGWHCFGCGAGGSVIDFAMAYWGISFRQAVARLDDLFGLNLPLTRRKTEQERRAAAEAKKQKEERRREELAELDRAKADFWCCFSLYLFIVREIDAEKPRGLKTQISGLYAQMMWELPIARDAYERARDRYITLMEKGCKCDAKYATGEGRTA